MSNENSGQWQAQGNDIPGKGHKQEWDMPKPPTKMEGVQHLAAVVSMCTQDQRQLREDASIKATRYITRAPSDGIPGFHMKTFLVLDPPTKARKARIDLEITTGRAFVTPTQSSVD